MSHPLVPRTPSEWRRSMASVTRAKSVPVLTLPVEQFFGMTPDSREDSPITKNRAYKLVALVFSCMRYRVTKLIEAPLWVYKEIDGEEVPVENLDSALDGLRPLLERPNPDQTMGELLEQLSLYEDTTGGALIVKNRNRRNRIGSMYVFSKDEFTVHPTKDRLYGRFSVNTMTGTKDYTPDDVIYFRLTSAENQQYTVSPLDAALAQMNLGYGMLQALKSALRNAVRPGATFEHEGQLDDGEFERLKKQAEEEYSGMWNMGRTMVLEGGIKAKPMQNTLGDLELGPVNGDVEVAICQCFGVHPALVGARIGLENSSGFADLIKSATELFYDITQLPRWTRFEEKLTQGLLRPLLEDDTQYIRFVKDKVRALQLNMTDRTKQASQAGGYWTLDEQRNWTGKPKLPDGQGDALSKTPASPNKPAGSDDEENTEPAKPKTPGKKGMSVIRGASAIGLTATVMASAWQDFDEKAIREERRLERAALALFESERNRVVHIIERAVPAVSDIPVIKVGENTPGALRPVDIEWAQIEERLSAAEVEIAARYAPNGAYHRAWMQQYRTLITDAFSQAARDVGNEVDLVFDLDDPGFRQAIERRTKRLASSVTGTTLQAIRDTLQEIRDGDSIGLSAIVEKIRRGPFGAEVTASRARTIARTESVSSLNESQHLAAMESGVMRSKRWLSNADPPRARDEHIQESRGGWIPIDAAYPVTGKMFPHDGVGGAEQDVNCRCTQLFTDLTPSEANRES